MSATTTTTYVTTEVPAFVRRNTFLLAVAQCTGWLGLQMMATLSSIVAYELTRDPQWAGIPTTLFAVSSALAAPFAGRLTDRLGRKPVLASGQALAGLGSLAAGLSIPAGTLVGFLLGILLMGAGTGAVLLARSAAADMYPASKRAGGMSLVIMGGAAGAIFGPSLLGLVTGSSTTGLQIALPWLILPVLNVVAIAAIAAIRPDPRQIAADLERYYPGETPAREAAFEAAPPRTLSEVLRQPAVIVAVASTALVQAGMVMLMVTASLSLKLHGHGESVYGVMTGHFVGMLGLSLLIGRIADRLGRRAVIMGGALIYVSGALTAPLFENPLYNGASLFMVGLGWSLCYVAGNAVLADVSRASERGRTMGANDLLVGLTGAFASLTGGLLLGGAGYLTVGAVGLALGVVPFLLALRLREPSPGRYE
ncbi:MAG TPA: MFS transporter [Chloroflexia bacterium]|nr:MFS transporter [Chloroflexia bacterium]